jgi:hypothetical protein
MLLKGEKWRDNVHQGIQTYKELLHEPVRMLEEDSAIKMRSGLGLLSIAGQAV